MFGFAERADSIRGDVLPEQSRRDGTGICGPGNRSTRRRRQREGAVVRHRAAAEVSLMTSGVEDVSRERVIALHEENNPAAPGQIALVEPALAFLCEARNRQSDQERADH